MNKFTVIGGGGWAAAITKNVMRKSFWSFVRYENEKGSDAYLKNTNTILTI
jgi:hypothetical protein